MTNTRARRIGPVLATVLVTNTMIGSGIFLLPATLAQVGSLTILGWLLAMAGALLIAFVLAGISRHAAAGGGPCTYALEAFGPYVGFQSSTLYWMSCWIGNVAIAVAAAGYLASLVPALKSPTSAAVITIGLIWFATWVNWRGPRFMGALQSISLALGLIPVLLVAAAGWAWFHPDVFLKSWDMQHRPLVQAVPASIVLVFWAFVGLESASIAADVVENPRRNVPIATVAGVFVAGAVYIAASTVILGLIPAAQLARSTAPFADAVTIMLGPVAGALVAVMALIKTVGTLTACVLLTTETGKAAADNGLFPRFFARRDRNGIPAVNMVVMAVVASVVVVATISPTLGAQFGILIEVSTIFTLIVYVYSCLACWHYGRQGAADLQTAQFRTIAVLGVVFCIAVIASAGSHYLLIAAIIIAATVPAWFAVRPPRATPAGTPLTNSALSQSED